MASVLRAPRRSHSAESCSESMLGSSSRAVRSPVGGLNRHPHEGQILNPAWTVIVG
jgi:hypothetical protein